MIFLDKILTAMKVSKLTPWMLFIGMFSLSMSEQLFAQEMLKEVTVTATNYKYLSAVNPAEAAQPVDMLQHYAAAYDVKEAEFYEDVYDSYFVSFFIPNGKILAVYDKNGNLIRTAERYKNSTLPTNIRNAVAKKFPNWAIADGVYLVKYYQKQDVVTKKIYKLVLLNGDKRIKVKINDKAEFL